jgi:hypothetical protein
LQKSLTLRLAAEWLSGKHLGYHVLSALPSAFV